MTNILPLTHGEHRYQVTYSHRAAEITVGDVAMLETLEAADKVGPILDLLDQWVDQLKRNTEVISVRELPIALLPAVIEGLPGFRSILNHENK